MYKDRECQTLSERSKNMAEKTKEPFKLQLGEDIITVAFLSKQGKSFRLPDGSYLVEPGERKAYFVLNDKYVLGEIKQGSPWKAQAASLWAARVSAPKKEKKESKKDSCDRITESIFGK